MSSRYDKRDEQIIGSRRVAQVSVRFTSTYFNVPPCNECGWQRSRLRQQPVKFNPPAMNAVAICILNGTILLRASASFAHSVNGSTH